MTFTDFQDRLLLSTLLIVWIPDMYAVFVKQLYICIWSNFHTQKYKLKFQVISEAQIYFE